MSGTAGPGHGGADAAVADRAAGALWGLAIGDALGMPTQMLSPARIRATWGAITGFEAAPADHPIAAGLAAGTVTDDTEQAVLLARELIDGHGRVDGVRFAAALRDWEDRMRARGSLDLLGPSTRAAVAAIAAGTPPGLSGRNGTTNGAAMRVTPVGIATPAGDVSALVDAVEDACRVTHNTGPAIAGAAAVAAAVSAGVDGAGLPDAVAAAVDAARTGVHRGCYAAGGDVARRIGFLASHLDAADTAGSLRLITELIGTSLATQESVPAAFGVALLFPDDPWRACCAAASLGGDCDTIAAMTGAILGAGRGAGAFPAQARETVAAVNGLDPAGLTGRLLRLRRGEGGRAAGVRRR